MTNDAKQGKKLQKEECRSYAQTKRKDVMQRNEKKNKNTLFFSVIIIVIFFPCSPISYKPRNNVLAC